MANARLAYELFEKKFAEDPRWADLAAKGAKVQRPLWASTGTKNAAYSDCKYVDELVAKHIVNTMPEKTLNALADHGNGAPSIEGTYEAVLRCAMMLSCPASYASNPCERPASTPNCLL